ncbi:hypothetical protein [Corticicoccus populi]|uniref:Uncharacterized protein n=1 Tax=Corticicoccus populi TaxID=1812821 RepID=A0ABW5WU75_9STAP
MSSSKADLVGHIEQLYLYALPLNNPDEKLVDILRDITIIMNIEEVSISDFESLKTKLEEL